MLVIGVSVDHVQGYEGLACWGIACLGALAFFAVAAVGATWINRSQHDAARRALVERGAVFYERVRYRGTALLAIHWGRVDLAIHESGVYMGAPRRGLGGGPFVRYVGPATRGPGTPSTWGTQHVARAWIDGEQLWLVIGSGLLSTRLRIRGLPQPAMHEVLAVLGAPPSAGA